MESTVFSLCRESSTHTPWWGRNPTWELPSSCSNSTEISLDRKAKRLFLPRCLLEFQRKTPPQKQGISVLLKQVHCARSSFLTIWMIHTPPKPHPLSTKLPVVLLETPTTPQPPLPHFSLSPISPTCAHLPSQYTQHCCPRPGLLSSFLKEPSGSFQLCNTMESTAAREEHQIPGYSKQRSTQTQQL